MPVGERARSRRRPSGPSVCPDHRLRRAHQPKASCSTVPNRLRNPRMVNDASEHPADAPHGLISYPAESNRTPFLPPRHAKCSALACAPTRSGDRLFPCPHDRDESVRLRGQRSPLSLSCPACGATSAAADTGLRRRQAGRRWDAFGTPRDRVQSHFKRHVNERMRRLLKRVYSSGKRRTRSRGNNRMPPRHPGCGLRPYPGYLLRLCTLLIRLTAFSVSVIK